jgi:uncharacterized protein
MAVFADPTGAVFAVWQPRAFAGAELVNEPGAFAWNELNTRDTDAAKSFYGEVFGWTFEDNDMGEMGTYVGIQLDGAPVGGMIDITGRAPDEVPAHWLVYFAVENVDATLEQAKGAGGNVVVEPMETPAGRLAIVTDPAGAAFAVIKLSQQALESAA